MNYCALNQPSCWSSFSEVVNSLPPTSYLVTQHCDFLLLLRGASLLQSRQLLGVDSRLQRHPLSSFREISQRFAAAKQLELHVVVLHPEPANRTFRSARLRVDAVQPGGEGESVLRKRFTSLP